jgi:hypothetical protein
MRRNFFFVFATTSLLHAGCGAEVGRSGNDATMSNESGDSGACAAAGAGSPYDAFYNITSIAFETNTVVVRTKDLPDHGSPFYAMNNPLYEAYDGTNPSFSTAINLMGNISDPDLAEQDVTFRLPRYPTTASSHTSTTGGPIGIAINGVLLYNQYNGMNALLDTLEFNNFDQYNGHPTPAPALQYHYHVEPLYLTSTVGSDALVGFLLDGFPVYGPVENGVRLTNDDLDDYHGHAHATPEYPCGTYHYHFTDEAPWLNGGAYNGAPGTVVR